MSIKENVKNFNEKANNWTKEHPRFTRFSKALISCALKAAAGEQINVTPALPQIKDGMVLNAVQFNMLKGMTSWQLEPIFKGKKVSFAMDPETLRAVRELTTWQIDAILGEEGQ